MTTIFSTRRNPYTHFHLKKVLWHILHTAHSKYFCIKNKKLAKPNRYRVEFSVHQGLQFFGFHNLVQHFCLESCPSITLKSNYSFERPSGMDQSSGGRHRAFDTAIVWQDRNDMVRQALFVSIPWFTFVNVSFALIIFFAMSSSAVLTVQSATRQKYFLSLMALRLASLLSPFYWHFLSIVFQPDLHQ